MRRTPEALAAELAGLDEPVVLAGDGARRYAGDTGCGARACCGGEALDFPPPGVLAALALAGRGRGRDRPTSAAVLPHYLRDADTRINWETPGAGVPRRGALNGPRPGTARARLATDDAPEPGPDAWPGRCGWCRCAGATCAAWCRSRRPIYPRPWSSTLFLSELAQRRSRRYMVATIGPLVVGYCGLMVVAEDGHITTLTVDPAWHRRGIGTVLLLDQARAAPSLGVRHLTLEVRASNTPAQALYRRFGFAPVGVRRNYYAETGEDAIVMWAHDIDTADYAEAPGRDRGPAAARTPVTGTGGLVLGIETSCDDTAAAVVAGGVEVLSSVVSSQVDLHAVYGGVVPELAGPGPSRAAHPGGRPRRSRRGRASAGADLATPWPPPSGPGLIGSLLVGVSEAKALALAWGVPFVGVNHLEGHLFAALLDHPGIDWPVAVLLVSGGHTLLVSMEGPGRYRLLGQTLDDAAGEAFDKVARFLGLGYPGGPAIERAAAAGDPAAFAFPRAMLDDGLDFSFSGLKTAVVHAVRRRPRGLGRGRGGVVPAGGGGRARGQGRCGRPRSVGARGVCLAGGVAANGALRSALTAAACAELGLPAYLPSRAMCTDNAAMIAAAGWWQLEHVGPTPLDAGADPNLRLPLLGLRRPGAGGGPVARGRGARYR